MRRMRLWMEIRVGDKDLDDAQAEEDEEQDEG